MGVLDYILMGSILAGASWLFYRSFWKKGGACGACHIASTCTVKELKRK
ncbi:MAG: hypothetical protein Kow00108_05400 [Calditrichia bacterium]